MKKQSVAAACVTALLLLTTACGKAEEPALPLPQEEQVKTICQLAVLECEYHNLAKYQDGQKVERFLWMTKGKRFWVEYSATAVLGIDADQVSMELQGDVVSINFDTGVITDETTGQTFQAAPFPPFIQNIIAKGGLMNSLKD